MKQLVEVFGIPFWAAPSIQTVVDYLMCTPASTAQLPLVWTPNAQQITELESDTKLKTQLVNADIVLADGMPIVWASKRKTKQIPTRLTGADLFASLLPAAQQQQVPVLLVLASQQLAQHYAGQPHTKVLVAPMLHSPGVIDAFSELIAAHLATYPAQLCIIGLGFPRQERLALALAERLKTECPWLLCLGASAAFYAGLAQRAPLWMQKAGLEWLYRLWKEPKRLFYRYTIGNFKFVKLMIKELFSE